MKRRLNAVLLAVGLTVSAFSMGVYAEETETAATEQVTEAMTEAAEEAQTEAPAQEETDGAQTEASAETEAVSPEDWYKNQLEVMLAQVSSLTDEDIETWIESDDLSSQAIATNWKSVKEELGAFVEITEVEATPEGSEIHAKAKYEKTGDSVVDVTYSVVKETNSVTMNWEVDYPLGVLMQRAGMNTVMGLGIVFLTLLFLSALIAQLHIIPDMIEKRSKKNAPAPAPAPAAAPAPVVEEEELTDDLELVAVITAAIAASENTSSDGFVVRSIKKANKRNWQRA